MKALQILQATPDKETLQTDRQEEDGDLLIEEEMKSRRRKKKSKGFLPESADQFAQDVIYPAFSPTVGVFLALSSLYGIWKSRQ
ncbi:hypothetical protein WJX75_000435 [Coccomyxa subellipsoidea]|uniref:Uncharacterized protein n=1 Tax=Coccomyxa subellipsoidea TaxID=248742 RepID=A0ABR2YQK4_9CHLO